MFRPPPADTNHVRQRMTGATTKEAVPARRRDGHGSRRGEADGDRFIGDASAWAMPMLVAPNGLTREFFR
jgi:hypothetical protein